MSVFNEYGVPIAYVQEQANKAADIFRTMLSTMPDVPLGDIRGLESYFLCGISVAASEAILSRAIKMKKAKELKTY